MINIGGKNKFLKHILEIFAFFMLTGIFSTLLLPETKGFSLEDLSAEDQENFVRDTNIPVASVVPKVPIRSDRSDETSHQTEA